ncbi:MAG: hypothetical protein ACXABY_37535, partial [Candidatus Thorarchaeota archaeon]
MSTDGKVEIVESNGFNNQSEIKLNLDINIQDITDMMVVEKEENMILEKDTVMGNLEGAKKKHKALCKDLETMGDKLVKSTSIDAKAKKLCT